MGSKYTGKVNSKGLKGEVFYMHYGLPSDCYTGKEWGLGTEMEGIVLNHSGAEKT